MSDPVEGRLERIESKLDQMHSAVVTLARIDERQVAHSERMDRIDSRTDAIESRVKALEGRTGWLPGVERLFWVAIAAAIGWLGKLF